LKIKSTNQDFSVLGDGLAGRFVILFKSKSSWDYGARKELHKNTDFTKKKLRENGNPD